MLPTTERMHDPAAAHDVGGLLTGDLGVIVVRALVEAGAGYVVSSWRDRPTPIDAAIDDARERVLSPHGVVLRRLRSLRALEPLVAAPTGGITGAPPRGAVIFGGRRGLRPALEQFLSIRASGAVVGFCFDDDALRIEDALVVDPEPTACGIVRAIDAAYVASLECGRPALIVVRERSLGLRGTIRVRKPLSPRAAADADAAHRAEHGFVEVAAAAERGGLVSVQLGAGSAHRRAVLVSGPMQQACERALAELAAVLDSEGRAAVDGVALVSSRAVGVLPARDGTAAAVLAAATSVAVVGQRAQRTAERMRHAGSAAAVTPALLDPGSVRGEQLVAALASWLAADAELGEQARATLASRATAPIGGASTGLVRTDQRVPRRSEVLHRAVSPAVAAGLVLAQGVIGVPGRVDVEYPTYRTDSGVPLTVVPARLFAAHGAASAAPGIGTGVFVVTGSAGGIAEAAASIHATIEHVDGTSPRAIGAAIARACRAPRLAPHVIAVAELQRVAAPRRATFGMDPDLVGTERLATSAVPASATALVDLGDELLTGPAVLALDQAEAHAALDPLRELSPATWDLRRRPGAGSRTARASWSLRRRLVRAATGVDL